jgi:hypothetical protein
MDLHRVRAGLLEHLAHHAFGLPGSGTRRRTYRPIRSTYWARRSTEDEVSVGGWGGGAAAVTMGILRRACEGSCRVRVGAPGRVAASPQGLTQPGPFRPLWACRACPPEGAPGWWFDLARLCLADGLSREPNAPTTFVPWREQRVCRLSSARPSVRGAS